MDFCLCVDMASTIARGSLRPLPTCEECALRNLPKESCVAQRESESKRPPSSPVHSVQSRVPPAPKHTEKKNAVLIRGRYAVQIKTLFEQGIAAA